MRISSIECTRVLAILAVMAIHISPFANPFDPTAWASPVYVYLAGFINQIARFAVPFFFLTSGYFLQPHLQSGAPLRAAWHYCKPLLLLWGVWSLLYIVIPFSPWQVPAQGYVATMQMQWGMLLSDPLNQWWVGGMVHLWFLPALILAVLVMGLAYHWQRPAWGLLLGGVLKGQELIDSAKVKNLAQDFRSIPALIHAYQDRFRALPGDDARARLHLCPGGSECTALGNGNGIIDGAWNDTADSDAFRFWQHVRLANLASGSTDTGSASYLPRNALGGRLGVQRAGTGSRHAGPPAPRRSD